MEICVTEFSDNVNKLQKRWLPLLDVKLGFEFMAIGLTSMSCKPC